jgi:RluA family pseudouridine synthase
MQDRILYIDNHLLVIAKQAGELVQGDRTGDLSLLDKAKAYLKTEFSKPGNVFLGLVHRLDRPTSGVIVFARTSKAAKRLSQEFRERSVEKIYLGLVEKKCPARGSLQDYLFKDRAGTVRVKSAQYTGAQKAIMHYKRLAFSGEFSLVKISLETGRAHQIRVQMANHGFPLLGDFRYGSKRTFDQRNLALHALSITVTHPTLLNRQTFVAPTPQSWLRYFPELRTSEFDSNHQTN